MKICNQSHLQWTRIHYQYKGNSLEARKKKLIDRMIPHSGLYTSEMLNEFYNYWTEMSDNGRKMRFEKEKVFEVGKRLARWNKRSNNAKTRNWDRL